MKLLSPFREHAYAIFRFMSGALFACHGAQKLFGALGGEKACKPLWFSAASSSSSAA